MIEPPAGPDERLERFTELAASRRRIVAAADEARRRLERELHDGVQQRLLALGLDLRRVGAAADPATRAALAQLGDEIDSVVEELREVARGVHPALLARGLLPALRALAQRSPIPVELRVAAEPRPPEEIETAVYYAVSEALTNAVKHSRAVRISIDVETRDGSLTAVVRDDGIGGAAGLVGLRDRIEALDGTFELESRTGEGTTLRVSLPLT